MPELPDVETYKRYIDSTALNQKIYDITVEDADMLDGVSVSRFTASLKGASLKHTHRHGKHLFIAADNGKWIMLHFGMTGFLKYYKNEDQKPDHVRMVFNFKNGYHLAYDCQRKLGQAALVKDPQTFVEKQNLGPDALGEKTNPEQLAGIINKSRASAKSLLMNQSKIAGIGNIYSDEILFQAGIYPGTKINRLNEEQTKSLYQAMIKVMETSIEARADAERLPAGYIIPHRQKGENCPQCRGKIKKTTIAGRTGYYCPRCQK